MQRTRSRVPFWSAAVVGAALVFAASCMVHPPARVVLARQQPQPQMPQQPTMPPIDGQPPVPDAANAHMSAERTRMLNDDRHKRLAADADKLVQLSNELKTDVNNTGRDELSMEVIRKAAEIEKLAHDVQSRMKN